MIFRLLLTSGAVLTFSITYRCFLFHIELPLLPLFSTLLLAAAAASPPALHLAVCTSSLLWFVGLDC
jgi:hypothetical protein